jgi:hypothetical protein
VVGPQKQAAPEYWESEALANDDHHPGGCFEKHNAVEANEKPNRHQEDAMPTNPKKSCEAPFVVSRIVLVLKVAAVGPGRGGSGVKERP